MGDHTEFPDLDSGLTREEAAEVRASFDPAERERIDEAVTELLALLGRTHAPALLREFAFADGPLRFSDLEAALDAAPNTLSTRLDELTDAGLLDRTAYDETPPRVEYEPTERAEALYPALGHLHRWAVEYEL